MEIKIFYSWQSDLPNNTNRSFIQTALDKAVKNIRNDESIKVEPRTDKDTQGIGGSPAIPETILQKIDEADIFVCDVSIINNNSKFRLTPNPNVLFELGYALKKLGWDRVIMICNENFGKLNKLPFDLPTRRIISYSISGQDEDKATERKKLEGLLDGHIRFIIENGNLQVAETSQQTPITEQTINAIENNEHKQNLLTKRFMEWLISELDKINTEYISSENHEDAIITAINNSEWLSIKFAEVIETVSIMKAAEVAYIIHKEFSKILERYNSRPYQNLVNRKETDYDFYKFIGHELFVIFISFFIREGQWKLIQELLKEDFYIQKISNSDKKFVPIGYISQTLQTLENKKQRLKLDRFSLHADELAKRYREGEIGQRVPFTLFMEADLFLFLYSEFNNPRNSFSFWWEPYSNAFYSQQTPKFLSESEKIDKANQIGEALGVSSIEDYRNKLSEAKEELNNLFRISRNISPLRFFNVDSIGSR